MSAQWLPFVLYARLRRYFETRRTRPLAFASVAWILQNLSCGYYLFFFSPAIVIYVVWEISRRHLWRHTHLLRTLVAAWSAVLAATLPFLLVCYYQLRRLGFTERLIKRDAALLGGHLCVSDRRSESASLGIGDERVAEGRRLALFPGVTIALLALAGLIAGSPQTPDVRPSHRRSRAIWFVCGAVAAAIVVSLLLGVSIRLPGMKITSLPRAVVLLAVVFAVLFWRRRGVRTAATRWLASRRPVASG